ncbi:MAG TPA: LysM peptidoglycan-binding domain-containing protein, partial [Candidatus Ligilactobacillus excrementipullorum]|nr:LysM peptidoglycan-binding domain-containing protein [Candidatus Ligilactobacillus excrementipullorum]
ILVVGGWWFAEKSQFSLTHRQSAESSKLESRKQADSSSLAVELKKSSSQQTAAKKVQEASSTKQASSAKKASASSASSASSSSASSSSSSSAESKEETQTVNVGDGETIGELAQKYATTVEKIQELNDMGSDVNLTAGDTIRVPK